MRHLSVAILGLGMLAAGVLLVIHGENHWGIGFMLVACLAQGDLLTSR